MGFFERLQSIDRRAMYLLLAIVIAAPLIWRVRLPIVVTPAVRGAYDTIESITPDQIALISIIWSSGTIAENKPQTEVLVRHMLMSNKRFAIVAFDPQGNKFSYDAAMRISNELGKEYGKDWVHWGYRPISNLVPLLLSFPKDVPGVMGKDYRGTPLSKIPAMRGIKTIEDIGCIAEVTPSATLELWIAFIHGPYRTPIIYAPTAVMAPEGFNPLDAGQIRGMLIGMKGAAEYEQLLGHEDFATRAAGALSASHLLIIALIILSNIGYITSRRRREQAR